MIREYAPIALIPAAWAMTLATMIAPGIDTYWIQHMHYFMILFLTGFTVLSWKEMDTPVLDIWRKIIAAGTIFTIFGVLSFTLNSYSTVLAGISLGYWLIAPGIGCIFSAKHMDSYVKEYRGVGYLGLLSIVLVAEGLYGSLEALIGIGFTTAAASQTYSIIIAAKLDENL